MTRTEYMGQLKNKLKHLPKDNFDQAIEYYEEYFEDAGAENEQQAIEDLGSPQMAADQIIREFAIDNSKNGEAKKDVKKGFSGVWIVILAIFASPIALPLVLVGVVLLMAVLIVVLAVFFSLGIAGIAMTISAPIVLIGGFVSIGSSIPVAMTCFGLTLLTAGLGILLTYACYLIVRKFLYWIVLVFGRLFAKGEKKNEDK